MDTLTSTTNMVNEDTVKLTTKLAPLNLSSLLRNDVRSGFDQDIRKYLEKPVKIRTGTWSLATSGTFIGIDVPFELLQHTLYKDKIQGYLGFRATTVFRLQVNAQRYVQGRLIMHFVPQGQIPGTYVNARNRSRMTITQQPNVQFDANCDTEATLEVPYIGPTTYYNLLDGTGPCGTLHVSVYSPLLTGSGGNSDSEYTLWASFKDIELITPTVPTTFFDPEQLLITQAGGDFKRARGSRKTKTPDVSVPDQELAGSNAGIISGPLKAIGTVATFAKGIPLLSAIAAPVAWVANAGSSIASWFGYSNPRVQSPITRMSKSVFPYMSNCDAGDSSYTLGVSGANSVSVLPGFAGSDVDENAIAYILSIPTYFKEQTWAHTDTIGTLLGGFDLRPNTTFQDAAATDIGPALDVTYQRFTPVGFFSHIFKYYKGSITLTIKVVKTEFHTGRLVVAYAPGVPAGTSFPLADSDYLYREIIDLRYGSEFTYTFPYASTWTYRDVNSSYGRVEIFVLNSLISPPTVSSTVNMLFEVSCADDFEFAVPKPQFGDANTHLGPYIRTGEDTPFVTQSGGGETDCVITPPGNTIGPSGVEDDNFASAQFCIGEKVTSVLQLIKRSTRFSVNGNAALETLLDFQPFALYGVIFQVGGVSTSHVNDDLVSLMGSLYVMNRGSMRWRISDEAQNSGPNFTSTYYYADSNSKSFDWTATASSSPLHGNAEIVQQSSSTGGAYIEFPHYNQLHSRLNRLTNATSALLSTPVVNDIYSSKIRARVTIGGSGIAPVIRRQVGDDFQFGYFIGIPLIATAWV
jgi:hypothetical protein